MAGQQARDGLADSSTNPHHNPPAPARGTPPLRRHGYPNGCRSRQTTKWYTLSTRPLCQGHLSGLPVPTSLAGAVRNSQPTMRRARRIFLLQTFLPVEGGRFPGKWNKHS